MSQTMTPDPEVGGVPGVPSDDHRDPPTTTSNQLLQGEPSFGDSAGLLFSLYTKAADEEDNKTVERWQKDADGILFFAGLFSVAVAALLAVTVQDLRPNSQDISAFYLGNIYQVLADPNATRPPASSPVAKSPSFSPPRYAVWVNTLWFLSLVMSVSCAFWATSLHQWARRYLRLAQPARCSPENRARMRAFFAGGVYKMHIPWAVEGLPMLLHLSLFLFFGGLAVFLFNVDREVFRYVICWIGLFLMVYGMITLLPLIRQDSPYNSPLSGPAWFLHAAVPYVILKILLFIIRFCCYLCHCCRCYRLFSSIVKRVLTRIKHLGNYYRHRMLGGVEKAAWETASERSSEIYLQILDWTISALGDDDSIKNFIEAIPGLLNSKLVDHQIRFPGELVEKFELVLHGFLRRTWSSNSVDDTEKVRRLEISLSAMNQISDDRSLVDEISDGLYDGVPRTVETGQILARWFTKNDQDIPAAVQEIIAEILLSTRERVALAARLYGLPERDLALGGDSTSLATLIHISRQYLRSDYYNEDVLEALSKLDIGNTLSRMQYDFCTLWNELLQEARNRGSNSSPVYILKEIRHLYIALHQGTDSAPTAFSASTTRHDHILYKPSSYPFCDLTSHRPNSTAHLSPPPPTSPGKSPDASSPSPINGGKTASQQAKRVNVTVPHPTTTGEIAATSHGPDIVATSAAPGTTASTHAPPTIPPVSTPLPNTLSEPYDAGLVAVSSSPHFAPPSLRPSFPATRPTFNHTLPRLRPRGPANAKNICFANAVLQLLVNSPPFWNIFREMGYLKVQHGAGVPETCGGSTPLVDATVRFLKEFLVEEPPSRQQQPQPDAGGTLGADEDKRDDNVVDSFEPTYMYDAMKKKRQLKPLLDGQQQDAEEFLCLYLDALDEELLVLLASLSGRQSASAALEVEEREASQSGQTEVGSQDDLANLVQFPITHIFGEKFRLPFRGPNQPEPVHTEDWRSLHLDIQHDSIRTVQDALARISQPQFGVQVTSSVSGLGNASQQVLVKALPPVLVLHLNRVQYDAAAGGITKIEKSIQFGPELKIPLDIMAPTAQRPSEPPNYKLYGILYHHGKSASSGHYTVDVLCPNGDGGTGEVWLHIDNETVSPVKHEDMFGEHGMERAADERCAYLLLYCRISEIGT